jgi:hypothetical protein
LCNRHVAEYYELNETPALHELDPAFHKVTLENERLRQLVRDLNFHRDPVGERANHYMFLVISYIHVISPAVDDHHETAGNWRRRQVANVSFMNELNAVIIVPEHNDSLRAFFNFGSGRSY